MEKTVLALTLLALVLLAGVQIGLRHGRHLERDETLLRQDLAEARAAWRQAENCYQTEVDER